MWGNPRFKPLSIKQVLEFKNKEGKWLVENLIPENGIAMLSGEAGSYKTWMILHIAQAVASGEPTFGVFKTQKGNVLMIDEENRNVLLADRLKKMNIKEDLPIGFYVKSDFSLDDKECIKHIIDMIEKFNIKLITIDSFIRVHNKDENIAKDVSVLFKTLGILQSWGPAILLTHHHKKEQHGHSQRSSQMLRGSSDIRASLDSHIAVFKQKEDSVKIEQTKSRDDKLFPPFTLKVVSDDISFRFEYTGESPRYVKDRIKNKILETLLLKEHTRQEILDKFNDEAGVNSIDDALKELEIQNKISSVNGDNNQLTYFLPKMT